ncbi:MAG: hypothetical protein ACFFA6_02285 [Promethearchaeota archaeon]
MQKSDYIYMIIDNILVYNINLPSDLEGNKLDDHLNIFDEKHLKIVAGFNKDFLEHFLIVSKGKNSADLDEILKKMEKISVMIGPTGNLHYLSSHQIQYILTKLGSMKLNEIKEANISKIADEQLEKEFGPQYGTSAALENQLASAAFYLSNLGYSYQEIEDKFREVRQDPSMLDQLFTLPQKEIYNLPSELQQGNISTSGSQISSSTQDVPTVDSQEIQNVIEHHIESIEHDITGERAQKVEEILQLIKDHVKDKMTDYYERVFRQMHPDRLNRAYKMLKDTKRKSKRMDLYLDWFFCSTLLSKIELKVEHWQVSSSAGHGNAGVYTAGINFGRYDQIIRDFPDNKLSKVISIARRILQNPTKKAIQKLGQDLIAETGFDEHLYFTD